MGVLKRLVDEPVVLSSITGTSTSQVFDVSSAKTISYQASINVDPESAKTADNGKQAVLVNQAVTWLANDRGIAGNAYTIRLIAPSSGTNVLSVAVPTPGNVVANLGSSAAVAATGDLEDGTPFITLTSVALGAARNTTTFETVVLGPAANPTDTVLVGFTGTAAAIVCTITPNDGTNNPVGPGDPVNLLGTELVELINTGAVVGKNITITDASSLRNDQTATGGEAVAVEAFGYLDGITATFADGADFAITTDADALVAAALAETDVTDIITPSGTGSSALIALVQTALATGANSEVDIADFTFAIPAHGYFTGLKVAVTTTGTLPAPLTPDDYWVIVFDDDHIQLAATEQDAIDGVPIELSDDGSNGGVTTFTPEASSGGGIKLEQSNDPRAVGVDPDSAAWSDLVSEDTFSADEVVYLAKVDPTCHYMRIWAEATDGAVDVAGQLVIKGEQP